MTTTTRAAALGVFAALMLAIGSPQDAAAHDWSAEPEYPRLTVSRAADSPHSAIEVSWNEVHYHTESFHTSRYPGRLASTFELMGYRIYVHAAEEEAGRCSWPTGDISYPIEHIPAGCTVRLVSLAGPSYSLTISGLQPDRTYKVGIAVDFTETLHSSSTGYVYDPPEVILRGGGYGTILPRDPRGITITTLSAPRVPDPVTPAPEPPTPPEPETPDPVTPEPETPTPPEPEMPEPETPTTPDPVTPDPAPSCTYKHRIIGVPGTTGAGFTSQILIGSEDATATVKLSAYQHDTGQAIDVLDSEGAAVGASTSLAPANSIKRFRLEAVTGWHTVIVEHPTKAAMEAATVAMRLREPDSGVSVEHVPGIEHCTTASTTTETPAPDLVMRDPQALLWPQTFDWRASVVNIGDAAAAPTTVRVYRGARVLDTKTIDVELAAGAEWPMSDYISRDRPSVGDVVRICVAPVPGEAVPDHANNCASATVERN